MNMNLIWFIHVAKNSWQQSLENLNNNPMRQESHKHISQNKAALKCDRNKEKKIEILIDCKRYLNWRMKTTCGEYVEVYKSRSPLKLSWNTCLNLDQVGNLFLADLHDSSGQF